MDSNDVTIGLAFIAGALSFISPCVLPLVPAYIGYMGGRLTQQVNQSRPINAQQTRSFQQRFNILTHGFFFVLGFTLFFVLFGLLTTAAVSSLTSLGVTESEVESGIARLGGTAVILFGLHIMGLLNRLFTWLLRQSAKLDRSPYANLISTVIIIALIGVLYWLLVESWFLTLVAVLLLLVVFRSALKANTPGEFWSQIVLRLQTALYVDTRRQTRPESKYGYLGSLLMGIVFSAGWTPCIGPIYGAVLTMASSGDSISKAGTLLTSYSLGLGIPFLLTALALDQAQSVFRCLQTHMRTIEVFSGVFLILIGVMVFSGQMQRLSTLGSTDGTLGKISLNLESCVTGAVKGEVLWDNVLNCIDNGPKEKFYDTYAREPAALAEIPSLDGSSTDVPELFPTEDDPAENQATSTTIPEGLQVGQRAPDFTAQKLDGTTSTLSDYRGQVVLINFWATWCDPCREEMPEFQSLYDRYGSDGFVILAVNNQEGQSQVEEFVDEMAITFPVVLDESGMINGSLYGARVQAYPTSLLVDQDGVIVQIFFGQIKDAQLSQLVDKLQQLLGI
jgi:cytochrome c-type biogenesis protein